MPLTHSDPSLLRRGRDCGRQVPLPSPGRPGRLAGWRLLALVASIVGGVGCTFVRPPGWPVAEKPSLVIQATPWRMYGSAPTSWDLPGGDRIRIAVHRATIQSGMGTHRADVAFEAAYASSPGERIRCETEPQGPNVPPTRFGCWSPQPGTGAVTFWLAPGEDCPARDFGMVKTLTTPRCWDGQLTMDGHDIELRHGYWRDTGSPIGYVSWVSRDNGVLMAADLVMETQVRLYEPTTARGDRTTRMLRLLTVAISWWEHVSRAS